MNEYFEQQITPTLASGITQFVVIYLLEDADDRLLRRAVYADGEIAMDRSEFEFIEYDGAIPVFKRLQNQPS